MSTRAMISTSSYRSCSSNLNQFFGLCLKSLQVNGVAHRPVTIPLFGPPPPTESCTQIRFEDFAEPRLLRVSAEEPRHSFARPPLLSVVCFFPLRLFLPQAEGRIEIVQNPFSVGSRAPRSIHRSFSAGNALPCFPLVFPYPFSRFRDITPGLETRRVFWKSLVSDSRFCFLLTQVSFYPFPFF